MRHALITVTNSPYGFGGVSAWIERVTEALPERGWRVTTVTHALDEKHLADWAGKHPHAIVKPIWGRFARLDQIETALEEYLDREKPDAVVISCSYWMVPTIQRRKRRGEAIRLIGVCHADSRTYYDGLAFYRDCFDHVIGVSQTCYEKLLALGYPSERASLLPYGVPCRAQPPKSSSSGPLRLAYVGRMVQAQKRIFDFVPLVEALDARKVDYRLDFYGSGEDEAAVRKQIEAVYAGGRVTFHGWLPAHQIIMDVWPNADLLLLLSDYEGLSVSMLEAMGQGVVPVVSRVDSGVRDVIREGETGYTFPIGELDKCADMIASLDRNRDLLAVLAHQAWSLVNQEFSVQTHARKLATILDTCLERPAQLSEPAHMGVTAHPVVRLIPPSALVLGRRLLKRGDPRNEGYTTFP